MVVLLGLFLMTSLLSSIISPTASVSLIFPIADQFRTTAGLSLRSTLFTLMVAGSSSFITPFAYQTNLIVAAAAGYSFVDFLKFGTPLLVLVCITCVTCAYFIFP